MLEEAEAKIARLDAEIKSFRQPKIVFLPGVVQRYLGDLNPDYS